MSVISIFDGDFAFLSNFYPSPIEVSGITYPTVEHAFQALKTIDVEERKKIAAASTPGKAKAMGRAVTLRQDWEEVKVDIMMIALRAKFKDPVLRKKLLDTDDAYLVEGTVWHDNEWGSCNCDRCKNIIGKNKLGNALMAIREEIRNDIG